VRGQERLTNDPWLQTAPREGLVSELLAGDGQWERGGDLATGWRAQRSRQTDVNPA